MNVSERLRRRRERLTGSTDPAFVTETQRVLRLPQLRDGSAFTVSIDDFRTPSHKRVKDGAPVAFLDDQVAALSAVATACADGFPGAFLPMGVGRGKTLVTFLVWIILGTKKTLLFVPPKLRKKTARDYVEWRPYLDLDPDLEIIGYSQLSNETDLLDRLADGYDDEEVALVLDEAHALADRDSARTRRFLRFMKARPGVRVITLSGSFFDRSIREFSHLAGFSLRGGSPIPRDHMILNIDRVDEDDLGKPTKKDAAHLEAWAECVDVDGRPTANDWAVGEALIRWHRDDVFDYGPVVGERKKTLARQAFAERLHTTAGVYATQGDTVSAALQMSFESPSVPEVVREALGRVETGNHPEGEEVYPSDALQALAARQVSLGFYYVWDWSRVGRETPDEEWIEARKRWHRAVRRELAERSRESYDSPAHVEAFCDRVIDDGADPGETPLRAIDAREHWREVGGRYRVKDLSTVRILSDYLARIAADWLEAQKRPAILWYYDRPFGDMLAAAGVDTYGREREIDERRPTKIAAAIRVHGIGLNLHRWSLQAVAGCPSSAKIWEQLLGREHRELQTAEVVETLVYIPTVHVLEAFESALHRAKVAQTTMRSRQKLMLADFVNDLPRERDLR